MEDFDAANDEDDDGKEATAVADAAVADGIGSNSFTLSGHYTTCMSLGSTK